MVRQAEPDARRRAPARRPDGDSGGTVPFMDVSFLLLQALNGLASASSLFIISAGLTIVFGVTRIVNFAHGSFYMLGAYFGVSIIPRLLDAGEQPADVSGGRAGRRASASA